MGLLNVLYRNKQDKFDLMAQTVFDEITNLADVLDKKQGKMTVDERLKAENAIVDFIRYYRTNRFALKDVLWCGQRTTMQFVLTAVYGFVNDVERSTGYRFTRLNEPR
ncbi:MAG: hypothetical protein EOO91_01985 [Pedobacter sp.]|nr:MAG: hypothetical protein EOO91_01985 [Pedobacter sp.]